MAALRQLARQRRGHGGLAHPSLAGSDGDQRPHLLQAALPRRAAGARGGRLRRGRLLRRAADGDGHRLHAVQRAHQPLRLGLELVAHRTRGGGDANLHQHVPVLNLQGSDEPKRDDVAPQIGVHDLRQRAEHLILANHAADPSLRRNRRRGHPPSAARDPASLPPTAARQPPLAARPPTTARPPPAWPRPHPAHPPHSPNRRRAPVASLVRYRLHCQGLHLRCAGCSICFPRPSARNC